MRKPFYNTTSAQQAFSERKPGGIGNKIRGFSASRQAASGSGNFGSGNKIRQFSAFIVSAGLFVLTSFCAAGAQVDPPTLTCERLGYTMKESQCYSGVIRCPYDTSKVSCTDAYVGEIRIFAGPESQIPNGWKLLNSDTQISSITYKNLYSVIGFTFGGNSTSFQLPNLLSRSIIGANTSYYLGNKGGTTTETLTVDQIPSHKHVGPWGENTDNSDDHPYGIYGSNRPGSNDNDRNNAWHKTSFSGGSQAHNNMPPYTTIRYIMFTGKY